MRQVEFSDGEVLKFSYQLTDNFETVKELEPFIAPFKKYRQEKDAIIVHGAEGYAIFTEGKHAYETNTVKDRQIDAEHFKKMKELEIT